MGRPRGSIWHPLVPPRILNKDAETDIVAREGENLTMACNAVGHPRPQIIWKRDDGEPIVINGKTGKIYS